MTSKERIRAVVEHSQPEGIPTDMQCVGVVWEKLMKHYGLGSVKAVQDHFDIDIRIVQPSYTGPELKSVVNERGETESSTFFGFRSVDVWNGVEYTSNVVFHPLEEMETPEEVENYNWPVAEWFDYEEVKRQCAEHEGRAIRIGGIGAHQLATLMRGPEKVYLDMAANPDFAQTMFDKCLEFQLEYYDRMFKAADGQIDILCINDDFGTQISMLFSLEMWHSFFAENTRRLTDLAHKHGAFFMQHSCGAVRPIIPEMIQCGVDVLDPIQKVVGMEPEGLKKDFGDQIAFHGGIDTQHLLPNGTPEQVRAEAVHFINVLNRNGGYILSPSQDFEGDVPIENIEALYSARDEF
ncbi:MAG: methyltransferase [Holophagae bacterium]|nr:methyltransferase [Holophagae bacterium]